jgi:polyisoprenoid-binding protein YceI
LGSTPANTTVAVQFDVASLNTGDEKRDAHLKLPDFFDADGDQHTGGFEWTGAGAGAE